MLVAVKNDFRVRSVVRLWSSGSGSYEKSNIRSRLLGAVRGRGGTGRRRWGKRMEDACQEQVKSEVPT